jgi:Predicted GTPase
MDFKDDIVAISTPSGMGAISVIRLTGDSPLKKVEPFFKSKKGTSLSNIKSHTLMYGDFFYNDQIIDVGCFFLLCKGQVFYWTRNN